MMVHKTKYDSNSGKKHMVLTRRDEKGAARTRSFWIPLPQVFTFTIVIGTDVQQRRRRLLLEACLKRKVQCNQWMRSQWIELFACWNQDLEFHIHAWLYEIPRCVPIKLLASLLHQRSVPLVGMWNEMSKDTCITFTTCQTYHREELSPVWSHRLHIDAPYTTKLMRTAVCVCYAMLCGS